MSREISRELIEKFFRKECSPSEAEEVSNYLRSHREILDEFMPGEEWENAKLDVALSEDYWNELWEKTEAKRKIRRIQFSRYAVAASILIAVISIAFLIFRTSNDSNPGRLVVNQESVPDSVYNSTTAMMHYMMPDSSIVSITPGSVIWFDKDYNKEKRDVQLLGEATFQVFSNPQKPFTVFSGDISTTALGTKFLVSYKEKDVTVKLFEGKIAVKNLTNSNQQVRYLVPGDELLYANHEMKMIQKGINPETNQRTDLALREDNKVSPSSLNKEQQGPLLKASENKDEGQLADWYQFEKESLASLFDGLSGLYNVKINYDKETMANKFFIGKFEKNTPIDRVLEMIADLNNLVVEKDSTGAFTIMAN